MALVVCVGIAACGDDAEEPAAQAPEEDEPAAEPETTGEDDPLAGLDDLELLEAAQPDGPPTGEAPEPPEGGCAPYDEAPLRVWPRPGIADIVAVGQDGFAVAGYARAEDGGEEVFVATVRPGRPARPVMREALERPLNMPRVAPPGLAAIDEGHVGIAVTDLGARVLFDVVQLGGQRRGFSSVASGADQRFQPAIAAQGATRLVAYTDGTGERTTAWLLTIDGRNDVLTRRDLTPARGTGRSPLLLGDQNVFFIDAREATSTVWRQPLDAGGAPTGEAEVLVPLSNVYDPVHVALAPVGDGFAVAYTAVGRGAKTAVGLVASAESGAPPTPIVPSEGYGPLHVDAEASDASVVYVADAPKAEQRDADRELRVRRAPRAAPTELGEALTLQGPGGVAHHGHIARRDLDYAVVFGGEEGVYVHMLRCDEGDSGASE